MHLRILLLFCILIGLLYIIIYIHRSLPAPSAPRSSSLPHTSADQTRFHPTTNLAQYPDYPVPTIPTTLVSVTYIIEHRSALNGSYIAVQGFVVGIDTTRHTLTLAGAKNPTRNEHYDLLVFPETLSAKFHEQAIVRGIVSGSHEWVYLRQHER